MCKNFIEMCLCELGQILFKCQVNINGIFTEKKPKVLVKSLKLLQKIFKHLERAGICQHRCHRGDILRPAFF